MKSEVRLSTFSIVITWLILFFLVAVTVYGYRDGMPHWLAYILGFSIILIVVAGFIYMPVSISADDKWLRINRILARKRIPLSEIESVSLCQPTMAERRICGSGGFMGYWGWFSEPSIGRYFAYYGKASDCFCVTLKDGRRYLLGCRYPQQMVDYISKRIN